MDIVKGNMGWIEVVVGPMFSGKSEELIRRLRRAEIARQRVQIFKPVIEPMPRLLAVAEEITKLLAICVRCGNPAVHTQRLVASEELIVVGAANVYEARCRRCFEPLLTQQNFEFEESGTREAQKPAAADSPKARAASN